MKNISLPLCMSILCIPLGAVGFPTNNLADGLNNAASGLAGTVQNAAGNAVGDVQNAAGLSNTVSGLAGTAQNAAGSVIGAASNIPATAGNAASTVQNAGGALTSAAGNLGNVPGTLTEATSAVSSGNTGNLIGSASNIPNPTEAVGSVVSTLQSTGSSIGSRIGGLFTQANELIASALDQVGLKRTIGNYYLHTIVAAVAGVVGITSLAQNKETVETEKKLLDGSLAHEALVAHNPILTKLISDFDARSIELDQAILKNESQANLQMRKQYLETLKDSIVKLYNANKTIFSRLGSLALSLTPWSAH